MLKIKTDVSLQDLEKLGFKPDTHWFNKDGKPMLSYEFLGVDPDVRDISIGTGYDYLNDDKELIKFYELVKADFVELTEDKKIERIGNDYYHKSIGEVEEIFQRKINEIIDKLNGE